LGATKIAIVATLSPAPARGADQRRVWQTTEAGYERPGEKRHSGTATFEILQLDLVVARKERQVGRVCGGPL